MSTASSSGINDVSSECTHWVTEQGEAYVPGVSFHKDGAVEHWFKYERPKVFQEESRGVLVMLLHIN